MARRLYCGDCAQAHGPWVPGCPSLTENRPRAWIAILPADISTPHPSTSPGWYNCHILPQFTRGLVPRVARGRPLILPITSCLVGWPVPRLSAHLFWNGTSYRSLSVAPVRGPSPNCPGAKRPALRPQRPPPFRGGPPGGGSLRQVISRIALPRAKRR